MVHIFSLSPIAIPLHLSFNPKLVPPPGVSRSQVTKQSGHVSGVLAIFQDQSLAAER